MGFDIRPTSITVPDYQQKLYVCDAANNCIQIISTDGVYQGCLLRCGQSGFGKPKIVRWCQNKMSFLIVHEKDNNKYLSVLKVNEN